MTTIKEKTAFIRFMLPHATEAIGKQWPFFIEWAIAKAALECGWEVDNLLIKQANNCLGIKAVAGAESVTIDANTGPESGTPTQWRKFQSLADCFRELVNMWNWRGYYGVARNAFTIGFERIYTDNLKGHAETVLRMQHEVAALMKEARILDEKGRMI